jgi:hypothetical protein
MTWRKSARTWQKKFYDKKTKTQSRPQVQARAFCGNLQSPCGLTLDAGAFFQWTRRSGCIDGILACAGLLGEAPCMVNHLAQLMIFQSQERKKLPKKELQQ